jgi:hypothetical protein
VLQFCRVYASFTKVRILHIIITLSKPLTKSCMLLECCTSLHVMQLSVQVQIGCHTDDLTFAIKLFRAPVVTYQCCMNRTQRSVSCLWGGLLYIIVPKGCQLGPVSVTITNAVPAPYYKLGAYTGHWKRLSCGCLGDCGVINNKDQ